MVHAVDRPTAIGRLRRALDETLIGGLQTDAGFLRWLVDDDAFADGRYDTSIIPERWGNGPELSADDGGLAAVAAASARASAPGGRPPHAAVTTSSWGDLARREALR
jgi:acetyl/propionyl-CoA carboxylase alpha subunit